MTRSIEKLMCAVCDNSNSLCQDVSEHPLCFAVSHLCLNTLYVLRFSLQTETSKKFIDTDTLIVSITIQILLSHTQYDCRCIRAWKEESCIFIDLFLLGQYHTEKHSLCFISKNYFTVINMNNVPQFASLQFPCRCGKIRCRHQIVSWKPVFKHVPLRIRRALSLYKIYGDSTLLFLNWTSLITEVPSWLLKALVNIVFDRFKKKLKLCWLTCIIMFMWVNKQPRYKK